MLLAKRSPVNRQIRRFTGYIYYTDITDCRLSVITDLIGGIMI